MDGPEFSLSALRGTISEGCQDLTGKQKLWDWLKLISEHFTKTFYQKVHLCFVDDLDGDLLASGDMLGELDLGEVALADGLEQPVLADVRLLPRPSPRHPGARLALANVKL